MREKTGSKRFENRKPLLRYKRARFYSAQLGRFISRDPLGFVDGMNLFRAYFVPNHADPTGTDRYITQFDVCGLGGTDSWFENVHVGVAVDTWSCTDDGEWVKTGTVTFHFAVDTNFYLDGVLGAVYYYGIVLKINGLVLNDPITFASSPCQDRKMLADLEKDLANPPGYSAISWNCVWWSVFHSNNGLDEPDGAECDCICKTMAIFGINY